jgi:hypothetical protein
MPGTTPPPPPANSPPTISGVPAPSVVAGNAYLFRPTAADVDGDLLTFVITNKPSWASFSAGNGQLSGTPQTANVGSYGNIMISVSDGHSTVALPAFSIQVQAKANAAPTISGTPPTTVTAGSSYSFQPTASDADSDPLTFSISNKPSWATFSTSNGRLSGTPTAAGTFGNIIISVTDGKSTTSLAAFTITVNAATTGSAAVSWVAPTTNTDGSPLTNLAGFRVYYGTSTGALALASEISNPAATSYTVNNLASGTWFFSVRSYTTSGLESTDSTIGSKTIP